MQFCFIPCILIRISRSERKEKNNGYCAVASPPRRYRREKSFEMNKIRSYNPEIRKGRTK